MITQESQKSYSFDHACVVTVPIVLKLPLSVEPIVIPDNPVCNQQKNGYKQYGQELVQTS